MSVFGFMKKSRQAAKEHAAKQAEKEKAEQLKAPYKHVPSHAAIDALSGGPATWRDADRPKILEQNRRRSAMTASGMGMGGMMTPVHQGMPRVNSSLSHVSYPSAYASPHVHVPRAYSYSGMAAPGWSHYGGDVNYTPMSGATSFTGKGKEVERIMVDSGRASRASSNGSARGPSPPGGSHSGKDMSGSPVGSSGNSTSSQDDLEMKPIKHASSTSAATPVSTRPTTMEPESLHRLHPSHNRRTSDSHQGRSSVPSPRYGNSRSSSSASLTAAGIPPVPALPAMPFGTAISSPHASSSASSTTSSITVVPASTTSLNKMPAPVPVPVPSPVAEEKKEFQGFESHAHGTIGVATTLATAQNNRRTSKYTRFSELETISSDVSADVRNLGSTLGPREKTPTISSVTALPTTFDESSLPSHQPDLPPPRTGKLSKTISKTSSVKPAKKNRWSFRGSKSTAVAV
ncbi:hypothetical protein QBC37DRAFT_33561 [Rhypophila decipiens]|uniref:Uncharacterized protein n=1 Tax=Rhypophila decipiens TaxID=261697 RepID=A0AAN6YGW6_9PEZI|nr:hypothetical protein QBC37DRAFT_33561 [Rhypophila decipiens]